MTTPKSTACLTALLILWSLPSPADAQEPLVLVRDQEAQATVVRGDDAQLLRTSRLVTMTNRIRRTHSYPVPLLTEAANYLAETLNEMAGITDADEEVKVVSTIAEAQTPVRILLGGAAIEEYDLHEEAAEIPYMGFVYRTEGNDLLIFGSSVKGTANGIYSFLQDQLGVRWFGPGELFTVVPERETIEVNRVESVEAPDFTGRFSAIGLYTHPVGAWKHRMRLAETFHDGAVPFYYHSHNFRGMFPPSEFEDRPELYAMRGGRRHMGPGAFGLCYSNPEVVEIATEAAKEYFRGGEHRHSFSLGIHDGAAYCECEECAKLQPERTFRNARVASDMYFHFVNEVARRVAEEFPDRRLGLIAYNDVTAPPLGDIEPNVFAVMVSDVSEYFDPAFREQDMEIVKAWQEKGIDMGMYYYTGLAKLVPAYFPRMLGEQLQDRKDRGYVVLYTEAHPGWPWTGPMHYVQARLWWDADLDVDELLTDYFQTLYGPAAPYMQELFDLFEEIHTRPRTGGFLFEHYNFAQFRAYTGEDLERMQELIAGAHGAIEELSIGRGGRENLESQRLAYVTDGLRVFLDMLEGVVLARELEELDLDEISGELSELQTLQILLKIDRINQLLDSHIQTYREAIINDPTHSNRFHNDTATPVRTYWNRHLSRVAIETLIALQNAWDDEDEQINPELSDLQSRILENYLQDDLLNEALYKLGTGEWRLGDENLVRNPGFEETGSDQPEYEEHLGWQPSGAYQWAFWQSASQDGFGQFTRSETMSRSGEASGQADGVGRGSFIGVAPNVRPGQLYFFECFVKNMTEPEDGTHVSVILDWLDQDDQWLRERTRRQVGEFGQWTRVDWVVQSPVEAATAVIILTINGLPPDKSIFIDDVQLREIQRDTGGTASTH